MLSTNVPVVRKGASVGSLDWMIQQFTGTPAIGIRELFEYARTLTDAYGFFHGIGGDYPEQGLLAHIENLVAIYGADDEQLESFKQRVSDFLETLDVPNEVLLKDATTWDAEETDTFDPDDTAWCESNLSAQAQEGVQAIALLSNGDAIVKYRNVRGMLYVAYCAQSDPDSADSEWKLRFVKPYDATDTWPISDDLVSALDSMELATVVTDHFLSVGVTAASHKDWGFYNPQVTDQAARAAMRMRTRVSSDVDQFMVGGMAITYTHPALQARGVDKRAEMRCDCKVSGCKFSRRITMNRGIPYAADYYDAEHVEFVVLSILAHLGEHTRKNPRNYWTPINSVRRSHDSDLLKEVTHLLYCSSSECKFCNGSE